MTETKSANLTDEDLAVIVAAISPSLADIFSAFLDEKMTYEEMQDAYQAWLDAYCDAVDRDRMEVPRAPKMTKEETDAFYSRC